MKKIQLFAIVLATVIIVPLILAQPRIPQLKQRMNDFTNTLSYPEWQMLEKELKGFEDTTSTQVVVLIINSLEGGGIEDFASQTFEENKIGQTKKDNGVLLVIVKADHKVRIEVGYGLEGVLTDAVSSQIIEKEITPFFKSDNYFGGIITGVDAIVRVTAGEYKTDRTSKGPAIAGVLVIFGLIIFFFIALPMLAARRRSLIGGKGYSYFSGWGYGGGSSGMFGGGSSGMSGGGFSGGGGSSGGGGASGSW